MAARKTTTAAKAPSRKRAVKPIITKKAYGELYEGADQTPRSVNRRSVILGTSFARPIDDLVSDADRTNMLGISRYLYANMGGVRHLCLSIADYSVGDGYYPQYVGRDQEFGFIVEDYLNRWMKVCDVRGDTFDFQTSLYLASIAIDRDGDVLMVLTRSNDGKFPMVQFIPAHAISNRWSYKVVKSGPYSGLPITNGVIHVNGRPVAYNILGPKEDSSQDVQIPTRDSFLIMEAEYNEQLRGISSLASSIPMWRHYRDIMDWEAIGIKTAAGVSLIEHNEAGGIDPTEEHFDTTPDQNGIYTENLDGGAIRYFRANSGADLKAFESNRPGQNTANWVEGQIIKQCFLGANWPTELVWNPAALGGPGGRIVLAKAQRKIYRRQAIISRAFTRAVTFAVAKGIKEGRLPFTEDWYRIEPTLPQKLSIDAGRDANAEQNGYRLGFNNLSEIYGQRGMDWKEEITKKIMERKYLEEECKRIGVDPVNVQLLTPLEIQMRGQLPVPVIPNETFEKENPMENSEESRTGTTNQGEE